MKQQDNLELINDKISSVNRRNKTTIMYNSVKKEYYTVIIHPNPWEAIYTSSMETIWITLN